MARTYSYSYTATVRTNEAHIYNIILDVPSQIKKSMTVSGSVKITITSGSVNTFRTGIYYKLSGGTDTLLKDRTTSSSYTFSKSMNLSGKTKIGFHVVWWSDDVTFTGTVKFTANFPIASANVANETKITAAKIGEIAGVLGVSQSASAGSKIAVAKYNALATAAGASSFNSTKPLSDNMTALLEKVNGTVSKSFDSHSSADY